MLQVQRYLQEYDLEALQNNHKINVIPHAFLPLILLNYDAVETRKANLAYHEITRECRSLVLEKDTWKIVSRAFRRFFNLGEYEEKEFNWNQYYIQEKMDGSLISVWWYQNKWHVRTSGSWADQKICGECSYTWEQLVFELIGSRIEVFNKNLTYVFELTSPWNQVVKPHNKAELTLLSLFCNEEGLEEDRWFVIETANLLGFNRPEAYAFANIDEAVGWLKAQPASFEGFVLLDDKYNRYKVKNTAYLNLHRLRGQNGLFMTRNLIPLILHKPEEKEEILTYYTWLKPKWEQIENKIWTALKNADEIHNLYPDYNQKQFALAIKNEEKWVQSILFTARKMKEMPLQLAKTKKHDGTGIFDDLLIKVFEPIFN